MIKLQEEICFKTIHTEQHSNTIKKICSLDNNFFHVNYRKQLYDDLVVDNQDDYEQRKLLRLIHTQETSQSKKMLFVGIGGSLNGPKSIYTYLKSIIPTDRTVSFLSNDGDALLNILSQCHPKEICVVFASKSGSTHEVLVMFEYIMKYYKTFNVDPKNHFIVLTGKGSPLDKQFSFPDRTIYLNKNLVGRYSTISQISYCLVYYLYRKTYIWKSLLESCLKMDRQCALPDLRFNQAYSVAYDYYQHIKNKKLKHLFIVNYCPLLSHWCESYQQIEMETNGKQITDQDNSYIGPSVTICNGTDFEHSSLQWMMANRHQIAVEIYKPFMWKSDLRRIHCNAFEEVCHSKSFLNTVIISMDMKNAGSIASLFSFVEHRVLYLSNMLKINPWNQPEVDFFKQFIKR